MKRIDKFSTLHKGPSISFEIYSEEETGPRVSFIDQQIVMALANELISHVVFTKGYTNRFTGVKYEEIPATLPRCTVKFEARLNFIETYEKKLATQEKLIIKLSEELSELKNIKANESDCKELVSYLIPEVLKDDKWWADEWNRIHIKLVDIRNNFMADYSEKLIIKAKEFYYKTGNPIMTDQRYDSIEKGLELLRPNSKTLNEVGSK